MHGPRSALRLPLLLLLGLVGSAVGCEGCEPAVGSDDAGWAASDDAGGADDDDAGGADDDDAGGADDDDAGGADDDDAGGADDDDAGRNDDDAGTSDDAGATNDDGGATNDDAGANDDDAGANDDEDGGPPLGADAGPAASPCVSGASGTHALRFRWNGTTSGSTAWVSYETNTLPDTSRWKAGAYSQSTGYSPVFRDPFLGEGGLELSGTVFIDVELSTAGLSTMHNATLAIYGRSYNTTASGSFTWQTFSGTGATPSGFVANSAPYEWYAADVTSAVPAGDDGVLLRIRPGPPSNALIVNRVEICFDAS